ncbi:MAG: hypothetical protein L3J75_08115 [Methylococcaceae bacterium]|nr:hypothetical protein [Methylococcaceae bacterium]
MTQDIKALIDDSQSPLSNAALLDLINRHKTGDDGDVCEEDEKSNQYALKHNLRIFSVYKHEASTVWIITEADRSSTTILLPEEY